MRKETNKYSKLLSDLLDKADNVVLVCHHNPDGDAIGSMLGLNKYLQQRGKSTVMISPNHLQEFLLWMKNIESVIISQKEPGRAVKHIKEASLIILIDFNNIDRSDNMKDHIRSSGAKKIMIDHHPNPEADVDLLISEPGISSTAELVFSLIRDIEGDYYMDNEFIEAIYVGMMTDTGNFSFGTFDGDTLRQVALMLDEGLDRDAIVSNTYDNFLISRMRLKGFATYERLVFREQYNTAYIYLGREDLDRFNYKVGDTEGFVNIPLSVKGIIMSALFTEKEDHIKVSLRSRGNFNVNTFAAKHFKGGGHINAAGGRYDGSMKECLSYFEKLLENTDDLVKG
ncbi:MAG: DHH family phosphoesterase [Bacteroidota bacterium]|nr:DHH family phosphoesterase [Bacteroidota bacterium]